MNGVNAIRADVVFPCLDEREALPWVLGRVPAGWRAIVVDNGSVDGSGELAAQLGASVVVEPRRGFGAAVHAGLEHATAPFVAVCDADGSLDPAELPALLAALEAGDADLVLGARRPERGAWPIHARLANAALAGILRFGAGVSVSDLGPMRVARTEALRGLGLRDPRSGYPLEMVLRAAESGWRIAELPVRYAPRVGRSKVTGTLRGTVTAVRDMAGHLAERAARAEPARRAADDGARWALGAGLTIAVVAKECVPGRVKTRLSPPFSPAEAALVASLSLAATLDAVRSLPARRRLLFFDGDPSGVDTAGFDLLAQPAGDLDTRLGALCDAVDGPLLVLGMDTPQLERDHLAALYEDWAPGSRGPTDAWFGPAEDGGFWALALARPDGRLIRGVPMSRPDTGSRQLDRLRRAGLAVGMLPQLCDVDTAADAAVVAAAMGGGAFAAAVERLLGVSEGTS